MIIVDIMMCLSGGRLCHLVQHWCLVLTCCIYSNVFWVLFSFVLVAFSFLSQYSKCKLAKRVIYFLSFHIVLTSVLLSLQNMLFEIEQKVAFLSELSVHSESLLLEGRAETKGEAEQLALKLRSLKDSLMELQQMLQDKQVDIQVKSGLKSEHRAHSVASLSTPTYCLFLSPPPASMSFPLHHVAVCKCLNGRIVLTAKVMSRPFVSQLYSTMEQQAPVIHTMAPKQQTKGCYLITS